MKNTLILLIKLTLVQAFALTASWTHQSFAQEIEQAWPSVVIGEDETFEDYWTLTAQGDTLYLSPTGIATSTINLNGSELVVRDTTIIDLIEEHAPITPPGGSNTQIQYNNAGAFGGDSGMTTNGAGSVDITGDLDVDQVNINGHIVANTIDTESLILRGYTGSNASYIMIEHNEGNASYCCEYSIDYVVNNANNPNNARHNFQVNSTGNITGGTVLQMDANFATFSKPVNIGGTSAKLTISNSSQSNASTQEYMRIGNISSSKFSTISYRQETSADDGYLAIAGKSGGDAIRLYGSSLLEYETDQSSNYTDRSIVDKAYVDGVAGGIQKTGTPANNQIAVWTDDNTLEGASTLTFDGSEMFVDGNLALDGILSLRNGTRKGTIRQIAVTDDDDSYLAIAGKSEGNELRYYGSGTLYNAVNGPVAALVVGRSNNNSNAGIIRFENQSGIQGYIGVKHNGILAVGGSFDLSSGANAVEFNTSTGAVYFPLVGTTASAANAFLNSGSSPANQLLRSTSSVRYKKNVTPLTDEEVDNIITNFYAMKYQSLAAADDHDRWHIGTTAESAHEYDSRLVNYATDSAGNQIPDGFQYERLTVILMQKVKRQQEQIDDLIARIEALELK